MFNEVLQGDCLEVMKTIPDGSVDMVFADLPYGVTNRNKWDSIIPFEPLWEQLLRVTKSTGAMIFTATEPFTSKLIMSNPKLFRYDLIWEKTMPTGFLNCNRMPLRNHEQILVFYKALPTFNPQKEPGKPYKMVRRCDSNNYGEVRNLHYLSDNQSGDRYPKSVLRFSHDKEKLHPTQKPVKLLQWLINSYTNAGETILDPTAGSGSLAVAARRCGRAYILIEKEPEYVEIIKKRLSEC